VLAADSGFSKHLIVPRGLRLELECRNWAKVPAVPYRIVNVRVPPYLISAKHQNPLLSIARRGTMADALPPPACPDCRAEAVVLIATVTVIGDSPLDIYSCYACGAQFSAQRDAGRTLGPRPEPA
jgi:hypothetical protein